MRLQLRLGFEKRKKGRTIIKIKTKKNEKYTASNKEKLVHR